MTSSENLTAWFMDAATRHPDILHTTDNPRFFELEWDEIVQSGGLAALPGWALVLEDHEDSMEDNDGDYISRRTNLAFMVLRTVPIGDLPAKKAAYIDAQRIAEQVLAKLYTDSLLGHCDADLPPGIMPPVKVLLNTARCIRVGPVPVFDNAFGCRISLDIRTHEEVDMSTDSVSWGSTSIYESSHNNIHHPLVPRP